MISAKCKKCKKKYKLKDTAAGKSINCECGNVVAVPKEIDEDVEEEFDEENDEENEDQDKRPAKAKAVVKGEEKIQAEAKRRPNRLTEGPDLSDKKVCSKCKNIIDMSVKICPKCNYNTMGIKYDQAKREETTRKVSQRIYHIGKYVIPLVFLIGVLIHFNMQMSNLRALKKFEKNVETLLKNEMNKKEMESKLNPDVDTMLRYYTDKDQDVYFIAVSNKKDTSEFSFFGNGYFTLKRAGICYFVRYNRAARASPRYYVEDANGNPTLLVNPKDYKIEKFDSIAFKLTYSD